MQARPGDAAAPRRGVFYGWWVVFGCFVLMFYQAGTFFYGFAAFFSPIQDDLRLSATALSVAFALRSLEGGFEGLTVGYLVDRIGPRPIMVAGAVIAGAGMVLMGQVHSLWQFYAAFLVISFGASAVTGVVGMTAVSHWFVRRRSRALAIYSTGAGFAGLLAPVLVWMIDGHGWRAAMTISGFGFWALGIPAALLVRHRPEKYGYLPDGETPVPVEKSVARPASSGPDLGIKQALRTRGFWFMTLALVAAIGSNQALVAHQIRYLESVHISRGLAGLVVTGMTLTSIAGRLGFGWLGDYRDKRHVLAFSFSLQAVGMAIFASVTAPWMLFFFLATFGLSYAAQVPLRPAILADYYGRRSLGIIQGVMVNILTLLTMANPIIAGWVFDRTGTYRPVFYVFAALIALAVPLILLAKRPLPASRQ